MKPLILAGDESVDEEKFVGLEPWCYNCAAVGHLGDVSDMFEERLEVVDTTIGLSSRTN
jgi:hypothetical protein